MPELPEVETICNDLRPLLVGRKMVGVQIYRGVERLSVTHTPRDMELQLSGRRLQALERHGKYLLARLDDGRTWVLHLRMTGSLVYVSGDSPEGRFERARVDFDDSSSLRLNDMRKFATWHLVDQESEAMPRSGPDALSEDFSPSWLRSQIARRRASIKSVLLNQSVVAGVGNIYADEACWIARIDPRTSADKVGPRRVTRLHAAVLETLHGAIEDRGSSFSNYRDGLGIEGLHQVNWHVFRREGDPCERCGSTILKMRVANRGTHFCVRCQRR